ncbi:MAG: thioredoxin [Kiritimatiellia bacterium]
MNKIIIGTGLLITALIVGGCNKTEQAATGSGADSQDEAVVVELDDVSFDAAIANGVVLVDFWAPWCPPCRQQSPLVDKAAGQLAGKAIVAKVNVDKGKVTAGKFNISSIPTLIVFKDGKEVKKFVGVTQPDALVEAVNAAL